MLPPLEQRAGGITWACHPPRCGRESRTQVTEGHERGRATRGCELRTRRHDAMRKGTRVGRYETNPMLTYKDRKREKHESTHGTSNACQNIPSDETPNNQRRKHASPSTPRPWMTSKPIGTACLANIFCISDPIPMDTGKGHRPRVCNASKTKSASLHEMPYNDQSFFSLNHYFLYHTQPAICEAKKLALGLVSFHRPS